MLAVPRRLRRHRTCYVLEPVITCLRYPFAEIGLRCRVQRSHVRGHQRWSRRRAFDGLAPPTRTNVPQSAPLG